MFHKELNEEEKAKWTERVKDLGIDESKIDERLMRKVRKVSFGLLKLRLVLDEKGFDEAQSLEIIDKLVDKAKTKDLAKIKEWHEKHRAEKDNSSDH